MCIVYDIIDITIHPRHKHMCDVQLVLDNFNNYTFELNLFQLTMYILALKVFKCMKTLAPLCYHVLTISF